MPSFVEEAKTAGIDHTYDGAWEFFVGGGAAIFDCNGDRRPDLFLAGGRNPAQLFQNDSPTGGALQFAALPTGLADRQADRILGAYPLDFNNDDVLDLVVLRLGENLLLQGEGDCKFSVANRALGFDGGREWTTAFSATFEPGLDYPTLAFGNYVDRSAPGSPWGTCHDNFLFRPDSAGEGLRYPKRAGSRPAIAPCRSCSPTGTAPERLPSGSRTTATITGAARSSSGTCRPAVRQGRIASRTDGST